MEEPCAPDLCSYEEGFGPMTDPMEMVGRAADASDLRDRIMNPNVAKSEAEWWAAREIERLEACIREMVEHKKRLDQVYAAIDERLPIDHSLRSFL